MLALRLALVVALVGPCACGPAPQEDPDLKACKDADPAPYTGDPKYLVCSADGNREVSCASHHNGMSTSVTVRGTSVCDGGCVGRDTCR